MDLALSESQQMLKNTVRNFMEREAPKQALIALQRSDTGVEPDVWARAADLGWLGVLIPAAYGGGEMSLTDAAVLFEELGRGPMPGPFFSSSVFGALTLLEAGTAEQKSKVLPAVVQGRVVLAVAVTDPRMSWGPLGVTMRPERRGDSYVLNGVKPFVGDATAATDLVVAVRTGDGMEDISLLLVEKDATGVNSRLLPGFMGWQCEVTFENVEVPAANLLGGRENGGWSALERVMEKALPILSAYQVGGCQAVFDMSVEYSQTRVQFSVPIGRFQRVQDHIIRMVNFLDSARWTTYEALWKLDTGRPATASVHMAKAVASEAYLEACNAAHEVHAGIGSAEEYGLVKHTQMSRTLLHVLGDPKWHKRRMADALQW
ncbi:MAG: acyl-CoA dehydrogenase family protein [Dehalococcoidia bacterium]